jgi:hypothetical protein
MNQFFIIIIMVETSIFIMMMMIKWLNNVQLLFYYYYTRRNLSRCAGNESCLSSEIYRFIKYGGGLNKDGNLTLQHTAKIGEDWLLHWSLSFIQNLVPQWMQIWSILPSSWRFMPLLSCLHVGFTSAAYLVFCLFL